MDNTGEIVTGATGFGAFLGAFFAAWKFFKPTPKPPETGGDVLAHRVAEIERREDQRDKRLDDVFDLLTKIQDGLSKCQAASQEALARLEERRKR